MSNLVSVIVPISKVESYISVCVESILKQTFEDFEVLLVCKDDKDSSLKICKYYEKKDSRIRVIAVDEDKEKNLKNIGIDKAKGKYITFIDGGDTVSKNYLEYMVELMQKEKADLVCSKYYIKGNKQKRITYYEVYEDKNIMEKYMHMNFKSTFYAKLYKKTLFDEIEYPNVNFYDDFLVGYKIFDKAKRVVNSNLEIYAVNLAKKTYNIKDSDRMKKISGCFDMLTFIEENYPYLTNYCKTKLCFEALDLFRYVKDNEYRKQLYSYIKLYRKYAMRDERIKFSKKILCMRSIFGYHIMKLFYNTESFLKKPI